MRRPHPAHRSIDGGAVTENQNLPEEAYAAALASVPKIGPATLRQLLAADKPSEAWARSPYEGDAARIWQRHEERGIEVCWRGGPDYPDRLGGDPDAPAVLFCLGNPAAVNRHPTVALVGTRSPTRYGIGVAAQFGADLAAAGGSVVSGLALGIDGAAQRRFHLVNGAAGAVVSRQGIPQLYAGAGSLKTGTRASRLPGGAAGFQRRHRRH